MRPLGRDGEAAAGVDAVRVVEVQQKAMKEGSAHEGRRITHLWFSCYHTRLIREWNEKTILSNVLHIARQRKNP